MPGFAVESPELIPVLSRGKHRNPRKGACFMEFVSYLAGERWSDHPACTHPLLAGLARLVNDLTSDAARPKLAGLIPSVIGLTSEDPRVDVRIALRAATTALPVVSADRQRVLAVSVLVAEHVRAQLDGRTYSELEPRSKDALALVPHAAEWAEGFRRRFGTSPKGFRQYAAPSAVRVSVEGIARACVNDTDALLRELLVTAIDDCTVLIRGEAAAADVDPTKWAAACRLSGTVASS